MTKLKDLKAHLMEDAEFHEEYARIDEGYALIEALVRARTAAKLTQAELARRLGTTQSAVARLEGGRVSPSLETFRRYAEATGTRLTVGLVPRTASQGQPGGDLEDARNNRDSYRKPATQRQARTETATHGDNCERGLEESTVQRAAKDEGEYLHPVWWIRPLEDSKVWMEYGRNAYNQALDMEEGVTRGSLLNVACVMSGMAIEIGLKAVQASDFQVVNKKHSTSEIYEQMLGDRKQWLAEILEILKWEDPEQFFAVVDEQLTRPARRYWEPTPEGNRWADNRAWLINRQREDIVMPRDWTPKGIAKIWRILYMTAQQNLRWACICLEEKGWRSPYKNRGRMKKAWRTCKEIREREPEEERVNERRDIWEILQDGRWTYNKPEVVREEGKGSTRGPMDGTAVIHYHSGLELEVVGPAFIPNMSLVDGIRREGHERERGLFDSLKLEAVRDGEGFLVTDGRRKRRLWLDLKVDSRRQKLRIRPRHHDEEQG